MFIPSWPNVQIVTDEDYPVYDPAAFVERLEAAKPPPEVPPPVWDGRPIDPAACHSATHALCG
jgi:hypothetical protein